MRHQVNAGQRIDLILPDEARSIVIPETIPLEVIYEDRDILVVDKPAGILVHPSGKEITGTLANGVAGHLLAHGEPSRAGVVTRLDRQTSGLVLFAKHPHAHHILSRAIAAGELQRSYLGVVVGLVEADEGTIDAPIRRVSPFHPHREVGPGGQRAVTHFRVVRRFTGPPAASFLEFRLETGRTHQIRVHLAHIGHPLIGDPHYGQADGRVLARQALHASALSFSHPLHKTRLRFQSPLPFDIQRLIDGLSAPSPAGDA